MTVKVDDRKLRQIQAEIEKAGRAYVKVGVLSSDGGGAEHSDGITMVELAAIHEFGSPAANIPERSFIRRTFTDQKGKFTALAAKLVRQIFEGKMTTDRALELLGTWGATEVKNTVSEERVTPKLEESEAGRRTIARKGSSVTLIDTGRMVPSVTHEVKQGEEPAR
jgi:hypothetical protein